MTSINTALYPGLNAYGNTLSQTAAQETGSTSTPDTSGTASTASAGTGDVVSLSAAVTTAQSREYVGLPPTGPVTLDDLKNAAAEQKKTVNRILTETLEQLGLDSSQDMNLNLDDDGNIGIDGKFKGKDALETALNKNPEFIQAFAGLTTNSEVMDYASTLQNRSNSLADYMNGDKGKSDLLSLARKYESIKSGASSIESLWSLSHSTSPFTYEFAPAKEE